MFKIHCSDCPPPRNSDVVVFSPIKFLLGCTLSQGRENSFTLADEVNCNPSQPSLEKGRSDKFKIFSRGWRSVIQRTQSEEFYDKGVVIQKVKPEEALARKILRFAQDDRRFTQDDRMFVQYDKMFTQDDKTLLPLERKEASILCAKHTEKNLTSYRLNVLSTLNSLDGFTPHKNEAR